LREEKERFQDRGHRGGTEGIEKRREEKRREEKNVCGF
jgi:hypothetical protein